MFCANMCYVCQLTVKEIKLKPCSSCKLIFYCSKHHQRKHWRDHKQFCKIVQCIEKNMPLMNFDNNKKWFEYRTKLIMMCQIELGRQLKQHEVYMILFQNNCQVCHKTTDLKPCLNCLCVNYCCDDHKNIDFDHHNLICHSFSLSLKIDFYDQKNIFIPHYDIRQGNIELLDDINFFIESNIILQREQECKDIEDALLSELITCPLTLVFALNRLNYRFPENAVIHVVGSTRLETSFLKSWEIILHFYSNIRNLHIYFIGPEAKKSFDSTLYLEKMKLQVSDNFYHDFVKDDKNEKPHLICAFNCGFHEYEGLPIDTWKNSLPFLISNKHVPFIFTSFTKNEVNKDVKQLRQIEPDLNIKSGINPFSSLRPYRDPENLGIFFNNKYVSTVFNCGD